MYQSFYGFRERPFTLSPGPGFLFLDEEHQAALKVLETAVAAHSGFCVISGEIGAGKTTLICELLNRLDETVCVGLVSNTHPSFGELLQWIMAAYGLPFEDGDELDMHKRFVEFVIQQHAQKKHTLLIIDEAQNLTVKALEELRMLSNINSERDLVLQIILVGQQQLRDTLQLPELEQFSQRVTFNFHLQALNQDQTCRYIQHRLSNAGGETGLFSKDACQAIYRLSGGIPRVINRLCDLSLVYGCTEKSGVITGELVDRVDQDQRAGALLTTPQVVPEVSMPGRIARLAEVSAQGKVESGLSSVAPPESHRPVANAESGNGARGKVVYLWLLLGVVVIAGGTGWMTRDFQSADPEVLSSDSAQQFVPPGVQESQQLSIANGAGPVEDDAGEERASIQRTAEAEAAKQRAAELSRAAERTAMLKKETERMEREQRTAEQRLATLRASRKELERKARVERKKMAAAREATRKLVEERSQAKALVEREKVAAAREAARELAEESARARARAAFEEAGVPAYDEDDSDAIVLDTKTSLAGFEIDSVTETGSGVGTAASAPVSPPSAYDEDDGDAVVQDAKASLASDISEP